MKVCPNCEKELNDGAVFCSSCDSKIEENIITQKTINTNFQKVAKMIPTSLQKEQPNLKASNKRIVKEQSKFIESDEMTRATIGNNFIENLLLSGSLKGGNAVLTQKYLYFKGMNVKQHSKGNIGSSIVKISEESVVDISDITMTKYIHSKNILPLIIGGILFIAGLIMENFAPLLLALGSLLVYFTSQTTHFYIYFAGGTFGFNMKWYPQAEIDDFQKQLHLLKGARKNATK